MMNAALEIVQMRPLRRATPCWSSERAEPRAQHTIRLIGWTPSLDRLFSAATTTERTRFG
jgi:hypothetical protein